MESATVFAPSKKSCTVTGTVLFPLTVGSRATVVTDKGTLTTSPVETILHISPSAIGFETLNSHYLVTLKAPLMV